MKYKHMDCTNGRGLHPLTGVGGVAVLQVRSAVTALEEGGASEGDLRLGVGRQRLLGLDEQRRALCDKLANAEV